ncbi:IS3 family transposase [Desulfosediminicola sp.]|uniref:IS3 family transposase n=1 Tax=Desulfosediminicola sp. TaxID=2886825 RepID=UPI003AF2B3AF
MLRLKRSTFYYKPKGESVENRELILPVDAQFLETPFYGTRQMRRHLRNPRHSLGRRSVKRLMRKIGLVAIYQKPRTSTAHTAHKKQP